MFNLKSRKAVTLVLFALLLCFMLGVTALAAGEADALIVGPDCGGEGSVACATCEGAG